MKGTVNVYLSLWTLGFLLFKLSLSLDTLTIEISLKIQTAIC